MPKKKKPHTDSIKAYLAKIGKKGGLAGSSEVKSDSGKKGAASRWGTKPKKQSEEK